MEPQTVSKPKCMLESKCNLNCKKYCKNNFLHQLKKLCKKKISLLIFDEVVTGFRYSLGGAQKLYGVTPDLSCFTKTISNSVPLSAVVGKKYMKLFNDVFFFTYGENV